jgi:hypothetical protein
MMDAALRIALQEFGDRRVRPRRLHQFDLRIAAVDVDKADALFGVDHRRAGLEPILLADRARGGIEVRHDDGDMGQAGEH